MVSLTSAPLLHSVLVWTISHSAQLTRVPSQYILKSLFCASELIACELGDGFLLTPHPKSCKAALKSHQRLVLPTSPVGRGEQGSPLHLPGWKDRLSLSAGQEVVVKAAPQSRGHRTVLSVSPELRVTERRRKDYYDLLQYQEISGPHGSNAGSFY